MSQRLNRGLQSIEGDAGLRRAEAARFSALVDSELGRFQDDLRPEWQPVALRFSRSLEIQYETETSRRRVRELQFTLSAAAIYYEITTFTDRVFVPDLGLEGVWLRAIVTGLLLVSVFSFPRLSAVMREFLVFFCSCCGVTVLAGLMVLSHSPKAPFELFMSVLCVMYCNSVFPLRFAWAWRLTVFSLALTGGMLLLDARIHRPLALCLMLQTLVGSSFSLLANYRADRANRLAYLMAAKESLRGKALKHDRDVLETVSRTDGLTGLSNRGCFDCTLAKALEAHDVPVTLMMLDVDHFKRYNDLYGHPAGDACLRVVAARITEGMRASQDLVFRYGGEEFSVLLLDATTAETAEVAERVRQSIENARIEHQDRGDGLRIVTASVGVARVEPGDRSTPQQLLERADAALYDAKRRGRNCVRMAHGLLTTARASDAAGDDACGIAA